MTLHSSRKYILIPINYSHRLFRDKYDEHKYSRAYILSDEYSERIKKFTLHKLLCLLLLLDEMKSGNSSKEYPCLFNKKSPHKETRDILLKFSSELLANVGDITRELKRFGYVLQHKQTYIDEFDYSFHNLATDLRDGVRITRIMEIILLKDDLTKQLRVPAISRLQKIHNVNLGLKALCEADFHLKGNITAADIVDGHKEKTLSLLWQIVYKFRAPKFNTAAITIQRWWRIKRELALKRRAAATNIQRVYRGYRARQFYAKYRKEKTAAAVVIQNCVKRFLYRKLYLRVKQSTVLIQRWYRRYRSMRNVR